MIDYNDVIEEPQEEGVPWTARDAWWGVFSLGLWLGATYLMVVLADQFSWQPDFTFFLAVGELSLMIPVWWFVFRKYEVDWPAWGRFSGGRAA